MRVYRHLFFDLDRTLWDFESNSREALHDVFNLYHLSDYFGSVEVFTDTYKFHNRKCWDLYLAGEKTKTWLLLHRFFDPLAEYGISNEKLALQLSDRYLTLLETKTTLFPFAYEILDYLNHKSYHLHIITNGFASTQYEKLRNCRLDGMFKTITTSEEAGYHKPQWQIFGRALSSANARKTESLMIGDDYEADILGAKEFGIDQVLFNISGAEHPTQPTFEVSSLNQLQNFL